MNNKSKVIDEKSLLPISFVCVFLPCVFWIATLHSKVIESEKQLDEINSTAPGSLRNEISKQGKALARIQGAMGIQIPHGEK